ncbi:F-box/LRR-repeat protein 12-like [Cajanus cajan]|uniref:F-box/LRR-repeat protein 12-like n=1 Tax=Cajanus cajan TaxID=3821 RepID=UPI00098D9F07|nr:F-box/LRR-repeat protein 12-like [Cajanus cajan]
MGRSTTHYSAIIRLDCQALSPLASQAQGWKASVMSWSDSDSVILRGNGTINNPLLGYYPTRLPGPKPSRLAGSGLEGKCDVHSATRREKTLVHPVAGTIILDSLIKIVKYVNFSNCSQISDKGLKALTHWCRQLQAINISNCEGVSGVGFEGCSKTLAYVEAESCKLKPEGVLGIVSGGGIQYLDVSCLSLSLLKDPLFGIGFASCLKILDMRLCRTVSDTSVVAIAKGCPLLEEWNLALCHEVRLPGWRAVGSYCQNLKTLLHVNRCCNLCDDGLQALREGCKNLSILYLNGCGRLTSVAIELFKFHRTSVCIKEIEILCIKPYWEFS